VPVLQCWLQYDYTNYINQTGANEMIKVSSIFHDALDSALSGDKDMVREYLDEHEDILAAVMQMADEEGCRDWFDHHLGKLRIKYDIAGAYPKSQRALLLALAYFAEEKSQ
jgi:DUF1680 family protein